MKNITVSRAAEICGGTLFGNTDDREIRRVIIDSRLVGDGDMFAAYKGENVDGHDYIASALSKGAACCLAEFVPEGVHGAVIVVPDVQAALEKLASAYRRELSLPIIGVTGSVGKTTAKEMIYAVLSEKFNTLKTEGNLNNQIGVPMTLSRIEPEHEAAVVEMGITGFGQMSQLAAMVRPHIAVYTVIGHAHLEFLHDLEGVFRAKTEMLDFLDPDGAVIVNGDDAMLKDMKCSQRLIKVGLTDTCDVRATKVCPGDNGRTDCVISYRGRSFKVHIPAYGQHMVYAALAAAAVGFVMGLSDDEISRGIGNYTVVGRRGAVTDTGFVTLVDDCYNATPDSMKCAVDSLVKMPGRHVCVLADMLEMGSDTVMLHRDIGRYARAHGVSLVITTGELGRYIAEGAGDCAVHFEDRSELINRLPRLLKKGDTVLVKASNGMKLGAVSDAIKEIGDGDGK